MHESGHSGVERDRSEENAERLSQGRDRVVSGKGTKRRQGKRPLPGTNRHGPARQIGNDEASGDVYDNLGQQDSVVMLASEQLETQHQKRRISGQANPGGSNSLGVCQSKYAVVEPIPGDIAVDQRVAGYVGKAEKEQQAEGERRQGEQKEPPAMYEQHSPEGQRLGCNWRIALRLAHEATIAPARRPLTRFA